MSLPIDIDRGSPVPIHRQVYDSLRLAILGGRLAPGTRIFATRQLAQQLGIARTTVMAAYEQLLADGYLEARVGAWTSVARNLPIGATAAGHIPRRVRSSVGTPEINSTASWIVRSAGSYDRIFEAESAPHNFRRLFTPAVDVFPVNEWRQLVAEYWREVTSAALVDYDPVGDQSLRRAIAKHVQTTRGIECGVDQILVTTGSSQAIDILAKVILEPGDSVAVENPSLVGMQNVFKACGAELVPIPVDAEGLVVESLRRGRPAPALVHVTPTHQFPTGVVLSLSRRLALLRWAADHRVLVVEDDNDSDLSYEGGTLEALQALDTAGVVAYLGTFSKVLNPSLQISYLIAPPPLVHAAVAAYRVTARQSEIIHQAVLAKFMATGGFARHLRRLRRIHMARRNALLQDLHEAFGGDVVVGPIRSGLQVHARWPTYPLTTRRLQHIDDAGVAILPVRPMYLTDPDADPGAILAYANLTRRQIRHGVEALAAAIRRPA